MDIKRRLEEMLMVKLAMGFNPSHFKKAFKRLEEDAKTDGLTTEKYIQANGQEAIKYFYDQVVAEVARERQ